MVQESQQNKKCSAADLYVVPYGRYNLMESMPLSMMKHLEDDVPPVFMILDTFDKDIKVTSMTIKILQKIHFNCLTFVFLLFMFCLVSVLISTFSVIGEYLLFPHKILHSFFGKGTWQQNLCCFLIVGFILLYLYCQALVQVPNPLSQQAPNPDPKIRPSLKNQETQFFGLG